MLDMAFLIKGSRREACGSSVQLLPCELLNPKGICTKDLSEHLLWTWRCRSVSRKATKVTGNLHLRPPGLSLGEIVL